MHCQFVFAAFVSFIRSHRVVMQPAVIVLLAASVLLPRMAHAERLADEQDWKSKLFAQASTPAGEAYVRANPEAAYAIFREERAKSKPADGTTLLWVLVRAGNPHSLEAIDVGMNDANAQMQSIAVDLLKSIAFQEFPRKDAPADYAHRTVGLLNDGGKAYAAWKKRTTGMSVEQAIATSETELLRILAQAADAGERERAIIRLVAADFRRDTPFGRLRRKIADDAHVLALLERAVAPPHSATIYSLYGFELFEADEACLRRAVLPYAMKGKDPFLRSEAIHVLSARHSPMATEILTRLLTKGLDGDPEYILYSPIAVSADPHLIPIYIGALEAQADGTLASELEIALGNITGFAPTVRHDRTAWERWWKQNRDRYPRDVSGIPVPHLKQQPENKKGVVSYPLRLVWREVDNDRRRGYWLACPTRLPVGTEGLTLDRKRPGLIVALPEDGDADKASAFWLAACSKAFQNRCFIAIPAAPRFGSSQAKVWSTAKTQAQVPAQAESAKLTTEAFVNDIVRDVDAEFGVNREACLLFGAGESGMPVYACGLAEQTPFKGFLLLNSQFHSTRLPSLARAKGRRFYLQNSPTDTYAPAWQVSAAAQLLTRQGAAVKQVAMPGGHGYAFDTDAGQSLRAAVEWLEIGK